MALKIIVGIVTIVISALLYRCGGMSKKPTTKPKWIPKWLRHSWVRDWLCPMVFLILVLTNWQPTNLFCWLMILPYYGLSGGALSTYWDWLFGEDNYYAHGFGCGLAGFCLLPFVPWWVLTLRLIICTVGMGLWSKYQDIDWIEEGGRGVLFIL